VSDFLRSWLMLVVFGGLAVLLASAFLASAACCGRLMTPRRS